jgi:signal transduction histidine kinase
MLAIVTHDLRAPLSAIVSAAAMQMRMAPDDEAGRRVRHHSEAIQRSAEHMARLVRDLTDIGQIHAGRFAITRTPQDVAALVRTVVETFQPLAAQRGSRVHVDVIGSGHTVECDGDRITQVLTNLTSNALKAGARSIAIRVEGHPREILVAVADDGPGIPPENLPHIFDRYWRGQASYKGTGLGLPISQSIVAAHGGRIWVDSQPGAGATFSFTLPRTSPQRLSQQSEPASPK